MAPIGSARGGRIEKDHRLDHGVLSFPDRPLGDRVDGHRRSRSVCVGFCGFVHRHSAAHRSNRRTRLLAHNDSGAKEKTLLTGGQNALLRLAGGCQHAFLACCNNHLPRLENQLPAPTTEYRYTFFPSTATDLGHLGLLRRGFGGQARMARKFTL